MKATRPTTAAALALTTALALGACGSSGDTTAGTGSTATGSATASSTSGSDTGSDAAAGQTVDGAVLGEKVLTAMEKAGSGRMTLDGAGATSSGVFEIDNGTFDQQVTTEVAGQTVEILSVGGAIYLKGIPNQDKEWLKIDPQGTDPISQLAAPLTGALDLSDPRSMVKAFAGTTATVVKADGTTTTYEMTVDPVKLLGDLAKTAGVALPVTVTYVLDSDDRPVSATSDVGGQSLTLNYSDWGTDVMIEAPDPSKVGTFSVPKN